MFSIRCLAMIAIMVALASGLPVAKAQDAAMSSPPAFGGGVFVTPIPGAPFSAVAEQEMAQLLKDGTWFKRKTSALIARDSQGRIHNESHEVIPTSSAQDPVLFSTHIYDPNTRLNTFLNPHTHIARQRTLTHPPSTEPPSNWAQQESDTHPPNPNIREEDLGPGSLDGIDVHGYRRTITISEKASGTGRPVMVTDEYWYSEELRINILTKHNDPRTGELTVTVTRLNRDEPDAELFEIPSDYKLVDMTPPETESRGPVRVIH